ncbi:hypothetical protein [Mucilaginibacter aquariorum]|uniref:Uncharacterized protein n=1 Tax=Mucilaginibacter aquariorum TaxID=2967225 RepID=A0ABT1T573_9SPHI|nr:hypothetical protein [Mucilaginibacter aquariorum]MCQ6959774.1 hypothetical protein [Mucilaginibacter aquariorum]
MNFLSKLFVKKHPTDEEILNKGFSMAMEFGKNFLKPINERLKLKFDFLSDSEVEYYNTTCTEAMKVGHAFIIDSLASKAERNETVNGIAFKRQFENDFTEKFNWVTQSNINCIYSQGLYFAWKEGLDKIII